MCPLEEDLARFVSGCLPSEEVERLKKHLSVCHRCASVYRQMLAARNVMRRLRPVAPPRGGRERLAERLARIYKRRMAVRRWVVRAGFVAAAVLVAIAVVRIPSSRHVRKPESERKAAGAVPAREEVVPKPAVERSNPPSVPPGERVEPTPVEGPRGPTPAPEEPSREPRTAERPPAKPDDGGEESPTPGPKPPVVELPDKTSPRPAPPKETVVDLIDGFRRAQAENDVAEQNRRLAKIGMIGLSDADEARRFLASVASGDAYYVEIRAEAMSALVRMGDRASAEEVVSLATDPDWRIEDAVVRALSGARRPETVEWLVGGVLAKSRALKTRVAVARALVGMSPLPFERLAMVLDREKHEEVRLAAAEALGRRGDAAAAGVLAALTRDKAWFVRRAAVLGLGRVGGARAEERLIKMLQDDPSPRVREAAARALASVRTDAAVRALVKALKTRNRRLYGEILTALVRITGQCFAGEKQWRRWLAKAETLVAAEAPEEVVWPADFRVADIPFWTNSVVFVVDCSSAMHRGGMLETALGLVSEAVSALPERVCFNIVCYDKYPRFFSHKGLLPATRANRRKALRFLKDQRRRQFNSAAVYEALEKVLIQKVVPDDIVLVSGGAFSKGRYSEREPAVRAVTALNAARGARIHTVGLFRAPHTDISQVVPVGPPVEFLRSLARRNDGAFAYRWITPGTRKK